MLDSNHLMAAVTGATQQVRRQHRHQCSLDVDALYTSIPVTDALTAVRNKLQHGAVPDPLLAEDVIQLLETIFGLTFFHH